MACLTGEADRSVFRLFSRHADFIMQLAHRQKEGRTLPSLPYDIYLDSYSWYNTPGGIVVKGGSYHPDVVVVAPAMKEGTLGIKL